MSNATKLVVLKKKKKKNMVHSQCTKCGFDRSQGCTDVTSLPVWKFWQTFHQLALILSIPTLVKTCNAKARDTL